MDANIYDLVKESTSTTGNGLTLTLAALTGFARISQAAATSEQIYYVIRDGENAEVGIGTVQASNTLDRTTPITTLVAGVYDSASPVKITLSGDSVVAIAPTAAAVIDAADDGIGGFKDTSIAISSNGTALSEDNETNNQNIGIGDGAGRYITAGYNNIAFGQGALQGNETSKLTGVHNIGIGTDAGKSLTSGWANVLIGYQTGAGLTEGLFNVLLGTEAGARVSSGARNIGIGQAALQGDSTSMLTGSDNIGLGLASGYVLSTGSDNILFGSGTAYALKSGSGNIVVGKNALATNESGDSNIAIGDLAGYTNANNHKNVFIGYRAALAATNANSAIIIGDEAGSYSDSSYSVIIGRKAATGNGSIFMSGQSAVVIGDNAAKCTTGGANSVVIGSNAASGSESNPVAASNIVALGNEALRYNTTASGSIAIGDKALLGTISTPVTGTYNIALGAESAAAMTSGEFNTVMGYQAGNSVTSGSNNVIIGFQAGSDLTTESGQLRIGDRSTATTDLIEGDFANETLAINGVTTFKQATRGGITALTDGVTITPNMNDANHFSVTLAGNRTLANPTNLTVGQSGSIFITQDGTGTRTLDYGTHWDFEGGLTPELSTAANAVDSLDYIVRTTGSIHAVLSKAWS